MCARPGGSSSCWPRWWSACWATSATPPTAAPATARARPPVLLALDEVANIAPIPDLPAMVSEGAGQGLLTLACLQDLSQARARWGTQADAFLSLFGTTVVLGGIADMPTLEALSALAGEVEVPSRTVGSSPGRRRHRCGPSVERLDRAAAAVAGRRHRPGWRRHGPGRRCPEPDRLGRR